MCPNGNYTSQRFDVSLIVAAYNEERLIERSIRSSLRLKKYNLKATIFIITSRIKDKPNTYRPNLEDVWRGKCKEENLQTGVCYIPVLPFISDSEEKLDEMVKVAKEFQVDYVFVGALTLYGAGKELYYKILEKNFPELLPKYRQLFKVFSQPNKVYRLRLENRAKEFCGKYGITHRIL